MRSGDRVVCVRHVYPDAYRFFEVLLPRMGVAVDYVDGRDLAAMERALVGARPVPRKPVQLGVRGPGRRPAIGPRPREGR